MQRTCAFLLLLSLGLTSNVTPLGADEETAMNAANSDHLFNEDQYVSSPSFAVSDHRAWDQWSLQLGVAIITENVVDDLAFGDFSRAKGDAGGEFYLFTASRTLREFEWHVRESTFRPLLELRGTLGVVNERGRSPFMDYNVGITLRWRDFPWNEWIYTNLESGVGLSYTQKVLAIERQRHPDRDRSHVKFYWPIQLTFAHPRYKQHQTVLFLHHQSGGQIFDRGGSNHVGIGYRYVFRYR